MADKEETKAQILELLTKSKKPALYLKVYCLKDPTLLQSFSWFRKKRNSDIELLINHYSAQVAVKHNLSVPRYSVKAIEVCKRYSWPGNIRELEQCVRQILLRREYKWQNAADESVMPLSAAIDHGEITAQRLLALYCKMLYNKLGTYEAVARVADLDRRTVRKHIAQLRQS